MARILVVEDEAPFRQFICQALARIGWSNLDTAEDGCEALEKLEHGYFQLCLLDLRMPGMEGLEVLERAKTAGIATDFVVITGFGTVDAAVQAMKLGACDFLTKPVRMAHLRSVVTPLMRRHQSVPHVLADRMDDFLEQHAEDSSLRVEDLCRHFSISPRYVSLLFKEHVGCSFPQRLAFHRVRRAKELIRATKLPLYAIARQCGLKDYRRLYEAFVRLESVSPKEYRKLVAE